MPGKADRQAAAQPHPTRTVVRRRSVGLVVALAAGTAFADAGNTPERAASRPPQPALPADRPAESTAPAASAQAACQAVGSVTGLPAEGRRQAAAHARAPQGRIVAWAVSVAKPNKKERNTFGSDERLRYQEVRQGPTSVGLAPKKNGKYKLIRQSPTVQRRAGPASSTTSPQQAAKIKKGQILASRPRRGSASSVASSTRRVDWAATRAAKSAATGRRSLSRPQTKVGSIRDYDCIFTARLDRTGLLRQRVSHASRSCRGPAGTAAEALDRRRMPPRRRTPGDRLSSPLDAGGATRSPSPSRREPRRESWNASSSTAPSRREAREVVDVVAGGVV